MGDDSLCDGCGRTLAEIAGWLWMSEQQRQAVIGRVRDWQPRDLQPPPAQPGDAGAS